MKIVTVEQMREMERRSEGAGVSTDALMETAGLAVAHRAGHLAGHLPGVPVVVLVGPGNNGGDGLVTARHLQSWGASVTAYLVSDRSDDPKLAAATDKGVQVWQAASDPDMAHLKESLSQSHLAIDALLGTGRSRPLEGAVKAVISCLKEARSSKPDLRLLALDLPTGLDPDTGAVDPNCPIADVTVALGYPKVGFFSFPGVEHVGKLEVVDIGVPPGLDEDLKLELMERRWARDLLPVRPPNAHKGTFGRALVVAGSVNYVGAAYLACAGAYRAGAGLVTLAAAQSLHHTVAAKLAEVTHLPLPEAEPGIPSRGAAQDIKETAADCDALLVGCGMGQASSVQAMLEELLLSGASLPPTVVDADGLNNLAAVPDWWRRLATGGVLTPHPGEMSRLTGQETAVVQEDRIGSATRAASQWNQVVVLKGAYTVVAYPGGRALVSSFATPTLATAGTGDVLSGIIVGLMAQGLPPADAAALGVYLHGAAGEALRTELGDAGAIASDLLPLIPRVMRELTQG